MKKYVLLPISFIMFSCGYETAEVTPIANAPLSYTATCSVEYTADGSLIKCPDGTSVLVMDGEDGSNASEIVDIVDPCGDNPGEFDEVLLVTAGGDIVAYFESSGDRFLTLLDPGFYQTTDTQSCNFEVTSEMEVLW